MDIVSRFYENTKSKIEFAKSKEYLTLNELSIISGYSESSLRLAIKRKRLTPYQAVKRGKLLFSKDSI